MSACEHLLQLGTEGAQIVRGLCWPGKRVALDEQYFVGPETVAVMAVM
jgi:hypothetical protein